MSRAAEDVVARTVRAAVSRWGDRLVAAYAIGSLAHGGFSEHSSDIDVALILAPPLQALDKMQAEAVRNEVVVSGLELADRLSLFWSSLAPSSLGDEYERLPAVDLLDLQRSGRLIHGRDVRHHMQVPSYRELLISCASFALRRLADERGLKRIHDPKLLLCDEKASLTKFVLYPARLIYTAHTGEVGSNSDAAAHFRNVAPTAISALVSLALEWRNRPDRDAPPAASGLLVTALCPLYRMFIDDFARRLDEQGAHELTARYRGWLVEIGVS